MQEALDKVEGDVRALCNGIDGRLGVPETGLELLVAVLGVGVVLVKSDKHIILSMILRTLSNNLSIERDKAHL